MSKNFKNIFNSSEIEPPKGLKQAVFQHLEKEKTKKILREKLFLQFGFAISGFSSVAAVMIFGKEILSSEFASLVLLGFSDMKNVAVLWQDYALSLLETLPTVTIAITLLPIFIFLILLREYGKLKTESMYSFKH
jgi:hypothetical protein